MAEQRTTALVIGSGAGGAVTALELARAGLEVLVLEEGGRHAPESYGRAAPEAMRRLYRQRGMNPILGRVPIGYVEGCCVGGSTEINSGFWHRTPPEVLLRWQAHYQLRATQEELTEHFEWAERALGVGTHGGELPVSSQLFARGIQAMGWSYQEVPRAAPGCQQNNTCAQGCPTGSKQGMSRSLLPQAEAAGARVLSGVRALRLLRDGTRVLGVIAHAREPNGRQRLVRVDASHVFVCCGPTETPALLLRSGIRVHVGNTLRIHPYLKVAADFEERVDSQASVLPLFQVKEFWPEMSLGGAYFGPGQVAMTLSDGWPRQRSALQRYRHLAQYYVGVRGTGRGSVRPTWLGRDATSLHYELSDEDHRQLSVGLARLMELLLAAGAREVYPSVVGLGPIRDPLQAARWHDELLPRNAMSLVTVHAFSTCPSGEHPGRTAADSLGRVRGLENLWLADASILPDSPGVNPQGTVMALARRNVTQFVRQHAS